MCSTFRETEIICEPLNESIIDDFISGQYPIEETQRSLDDPNTHWRILLVNDKWVGLLRMIIGLTKPGLPHLNIAKADKIYLKSEYQKKGLGSLMMDELGKLAIANHITTLWWNVYCRNKNAIELYEKLGAKKLNEEPVEYIRNGKVIKEHSINYYLNIAQYQKKL